MPSQSNSKKLPTSRDCRPPVERLRILYKRICEFSASYSRFNKPLRLGSPSGRAAIIPVKTFAQVLASALPESVRDRYEVSYSRGIQYVPFVLWVALCPPGVRVSSGMTVAICFGRAGEGVVAGLMVPSSSSLGTIPLCERTIGGNLRVNVNGTTKESRYNDRFVNPREFLADETNIEDLLGHVQASLRIYESEYAKRTA